MSSDSAALKKKILTLFSSKPRRRFSPQEVLRSLGGAAGELQPVIDCLRELAHSGEIVRFKKHRYALAGGDHFATGKVHAHRDGFGFLIPEESGREDLYLSRREMRRLMHGDRVLARIERKTSGDTEARVVQVLDRGQKRIVGTYEEAGSQRLLVPMDSRVAPIVLGPGGPRPARGEVIAAEISRYGTAYSAPEAEMRQILGGPEDPEVQARAIIFRYGLPDVFSPEARHEAGLCPLRVTAAEHSATHTDLGSLPIVTIDGETARDFDDAVSVAKKNGLYRLTVAIADVAHYVRPGTALDREAYERGTSVYFPDRAIPMLPHELSDGICSLNPQADRLAQTAVLDIDRKGEIVRADFFRAVIRSRARMTYTEVRRILVDRDPECLVRYVDLVDQFKLMEELALILQEQRRGRGNLDFDLPEPEIILDLQGVPENVARAERNIAHRIIEEFMIAANEAVARQLKQRGFPPLYRIHEAPDEEALRGLAPLLLKLGHRLHVPKAKSDPKEIQRILEACRGKPEERILNRLILRCMKQARYAAENVGHFGLASSCYVHFTSPIRRYPDLIVHRLLARTLAGDGLKPKEKEDHLRYLEEAAKHTSERERVAMNAEREMVDLKKTQFMVDKLGEIFTGLIIDLAPFGFFVELEAYFVEGLVPLGSLQDDAYHFYENEYIIKGRRRGRAFRLGDKVSVKVARINAFRSEITFELVETPQLVY